MSPLGEPPFSGTPHPLTSFNPRAGRPFKFKVPHPVPQFTGKRRPRWGWLTGDHKPEFGSRHPCPSSQRSFYFLGSVSVSLHLSSTPLSPSLPWKQDTFSDPSLEAEISTGLDASSQGSESFQGAFCHLGREGVWEGPRGSSCPSSPGPVQATQASPPTPPPPSGCVCPHTHLGWSEASLSGPAFMRGREMPALHGGCQHHGVQKRACTHTHPRANTHARVHTLTHAQGLGIPQMLVFVAASSVILSPWDFS